MNVFERFTDLARRSVVLAQEHARSQESTRIDLGLIAAGIIDADDQRRLRESNQGWA